MLSYVSSFGHLIQEHFCAGRLENGQFPGSYGSCHGKGLTFDKLG